MDRINGADTIDIGGGRRGFRDENLVAGAAGTEVTALFLNMVQEEILKVVTEAGLVPSEGDWTQLWQALQIHGLAPDARSRRWLTVISMTLSSAPGSPSVGDTYLIPTGATGIWATHVGAIGQWNGSSWSYLTPPDGHGISLPDGRVFERVAGIYVEKLALDAQSGKWNYAVAGGTANALTVTLSPTPTVVNGMRLAILVSASNTTDATLNVNGLGAVPIQTRTGSALKRGDLPAGAVIPLIYYSGSWRLQSLAYSEIPVVATADVTLYVRTDGDDNNNGSANNAANAFKTINAAINYGISRFAFGGFALKIQLGNPGTYSPIGNIPAGIGNLIITGDPANPSTYIIGGAPIAGSQGYIAVSGGTAQLNGVHIANQSTTIPSTLARYGSSLTLTNVVLGSTVVIPHHVVASSGGTVIIGDCVVAGDANVCLFAQSGSIVLGGNINVPAARNMAVAWGVASAGGNITWGATGIGFTGPGGSGGASTGKRYDANLNGVINTGGIGAFAFPGNVNGTNPTGGQYA